jgi:hypothetical protein
VAAKSQVQFLYLIGAHVFSWLGAIGGVLNRSNPARVAKMVLGIFHPRNGCFRGA